MSSRCVVVVLSLSAERSILGFLAALSDCSKFSFGARERKTICVAFARVCVALKKRYTDSAQYLVVTKLCPFRNTKQREDLLFFIV